MKKIIFIGDPLQTFDPIAETTFFLMKEVLKRKWECYHCELKDLVLLNSTVHATLNRVQVKHTKNKFSYTVTGHKTLNLANTDAVFIRKDPPVDLHYIDHLSMLEILSGQTFLINNPSGIKLANEKIFTFHFKDIAADSLVSQKRDIIHSFVTKHKMAVLKPLNLSGGSGVVKVDAKDPSLNSIIDILTTNQTQYIMAQEYLPEATKGDKRILLLDGKILGAFVRIPSKKDFRGNLHSGAKLAKAVITKRDREIVNKIRKTLQELGLYFVGLDVLGDKVTEINSTSPMGIREINHNGNSQIEKIIINWLSNKLS